MPQALLNRLDPVYSTDPENKVVSERAHWAHWQHPPPQFGDRIDDVRAVVVHETSGWPTSSHGENMFYREFFGGETHARHGGETTQLYVNGDGTVLLGMTLPLVTGHATFVNGWTVGSETGHSWGNYHCNTHLGPYSQSDHTTNPDGTHPPQQGQFRPLHRMPGNLWHALSGNDRIDRPEDDDFPGLKLWIRHEATPEVMVTLWTTERYAGPWRQAQRVSEMLFSEAQYRSWALLARFLAEELLVPRNFPLLPHKLRSPGYGTAAGLHGTVRDAMTFRSIVRADEILFRSLAAFGLTEAQLNNDAQVTQAYTHGVQQVDAGEHVWERNRLWRQLFDRYRGFHGHGFSGDPARNNDHDCPGPLFDWHRFAREVWDWWWRPFDFNDAGTATNVPRRSYSRNWNGDTPLREHYFSAPAARYSARHVPGIHGATGSPRTYRLEQGSPVYALATGDLVAARFPPETGGVNLAFIVVRHEVFHRIHPLAGSTILGVPVMDLDRLNYDHPPPSAVYSLYMHLGRPAGMSFDAVSDGNPDWLNRLLMRKIECELGVAYHTAHPPPPPPAGQAEADAWDYRPQGRPSVLEGWTTDDPQLRSMFDRLRRGDLALAPGTMWSTPIRVLLGDFLGTAGVISRTAAGTTHGVRVEVFSKDRISPDFQLTNSDATRRWAPQVGVAPGGPVLRYPSEWADAPSGAEKTALEAAGVDVRLVPWWPFVQLATTMYQPYPDDARLEDSGWVHHYDPEAFMAWLNRLTWRSEWRKYRLTDPAEIPATPLPR
jgi:hypothetical protein